MPDSSGDTTGTGGHEIQVALLDWIAEHRDLVSRLRSDPPCRVLLLPCGDGKTALDFAREYPKTTTYGVEPNAALVIRGQAEAGHLRDRVACVPGDPWTKALPVTFDLVVAHTGEVSDSGRPELSRLIRHLGQMPGGEGRVIIDLEPDQSLPPSVRPMFSEVEHFATRADGGQVLLLRE